MVLLTFFYTDCPDICPLTAEKLRETAKRLRNDARQVMMLVVSVDPEQDTVEAAQNVSQLHRLNGRSWHYLVGSREGLEPVGSAYAIGIIPRYPAYVGGLSTGVGHTDALYVIDQEGRQRALVRGTIEPAAFADGVRGLLK